MGQRRAIFDISADRRAPRSARRNVAATLGSWGVEALRPDAELLVSELITNAIIHAPGAASHQLQILETAAGIRLTVADGSATAPAVRPLNDGRPGGRGLRIVTTLASEWGYEIHAGGKVVWADLELTPSSLVSHPDDRR